MTMTAIMMRTMMTLRGKRNRRHRRGSPVIVHIALVLLLLLRIARRVRADHDEVARAFRQGLVHALRGRSEERQQSGAGRTAHRRCSGAALAAHGCYGDRLGRWRGRRTTGCEGSRERRRRSCVLLRPHGEPLSPRDPVRHRRRRYPPRRTCLSLRPRLPVRRPAGAAGRASRGSPDAAGAAAHTHTSVRAVTDRGDRTEATVAAARKQTQ